MHLAHTQLGVLCCHVSMLLSLDEQADVVEYAPTIKMGCCYLLWGTLVLKWHVNVAVLIDTSMLLL